MADPQQVLAQRVHDAIVASFGPEYSDADPLIRPSSFADFQANVALKTLEGSVRFAIAELRGAVTATRTARVGAFLQRRGLRELAARLDTESYGGAVLLGLGGTVVIAHGASTARAVTSACLLAADLARGQITEKITQRLGPGRPPRAPGRGGHFLRRPERLLPA